MKTVIALPDDVFRHLNKVAREQHSSRNEVIVTAVKEYLDRRKSNRLLDALNRAYDTAETPEEHDSRQKSKRRYSTLLRRQHYH